MNMVDGSTLLTTIFVLIDDWYQQKGYRYVPLLPGPSPKFTDSEMLTLLVAMDFFPYPGEQQFLGFVRANYLSLFPKLLDQSQFNRRARRLEGMLEELRRFWLRDLGAIFERTLLLDTKVEQELMESDRILGSEEDVASTARRSSKVKSQKSKSL
ncbi:hypothetical protein VB690_04630 [Nodularia spumigena CH309]|jgi:hypothetical protein|uniref:Uncharacterized protein n=1 Tax=Nodularia spumigena UHCC 0060 TaxID=3110300 RepID=A0ABU5ULS2_NODSP|nr:hypothetical protein [Nodularia spumigena]MEA5523625.1 hypothetical protein [Nodularia spumigena UHCC 0143]MEA5555726.1 hypothetical protein [Nodularia spumigena CH309]MEA5607193.1 hypothetical protein [Nodularia spumigena UHCC 0060]MEA5613875.1 hypothetical protein [Nodularia spumigena UHCC 0040]